MAKNKRKVNNISKGKAPVRDETASAPPPPQEPVLGKRAIHQLYENSADIVGAEPMETSRVEAMEEAGPSKRTRLEVGGQAVSLDERAQNFTKARSPEVNEDYKKSGTLSRKRVKVDVPSSSSPQVDQPPDAKSSPILDVPAEILAEILLNTSSPKDILSVSLTCKSFRSSLTSPSSAFIWKVARQHFTDHYDCDMNRRAGIHIPEEERSLTDIYKLPDFQAEEYGGGVFFDGNEAQYAAFVYGSYAACEICGEPANRIFSSFALRIRICYKANCKKELMQTRLKTMQQLRESKPELYSAEYEALYPHLEDRLRGQYMPPDVPRRTGLPNVYRINDPLVEEVISKHKGTKGFEKVLKGQREKNEKWMKLCHALDDWRCATTRYFYENRRFNDQFVANLAMKHKWNQQDLMTSTDIAKYHRRKTDSFEKLSHVDIAVLLPTVASQMTALMDTRARRVDDKVYHILQKAIKSYHKHLLEQRKKAKQVEEARSKVHKYDMGRIRQLNKAKAALGDVYDIIPCLPAFKELPVFKMLQGTRLTSEEVKASTETKVVGMGWRASVDQLMKSSDMVQGLKNSPVLKAMIKHQVSRWIEDAKEGLGATLMEGRNGEFSAASTEELAAEKVRLAEDLTSRWRCKKCDYFDPEYVEDECFDLRGVLTHECNGGALSVKGKKAKKVAWDASNFVRDDQAIAILKGFLNLNEKAFPRASTQRPREREFEFMNARIAYIRGCDCLSCDLPIRLHFASIVGHSHRHNGEMQIAPSHGGQPRSYSEAQYTKYALPPSGRTHGLLNPKPKLKSVKKKTSMEEGQSTSTKKVGKAENEPGKLGPEEKTFACRHCYATLVKNLDDSSADATVAGTIDSSGEGSAANLDALHPAEGPKIELPAPAAWLSFNGIRSHLAAKHRIHSIRDEDYFLKETEHETLKQLFGWNSLL